MHENPGVWKNGGKIKVYDWGEDSLVGFEWLYGSLNNRGSRNSREQRAKKNPAGTPACENASVSRYQSPLNEKGQPAEYLQTSQNSQE